MTNSRSPRLRTVVKAQPPYPLNEFPKDFPFKLGREIVYVLGTKAQTSIEGPEWEQIFADCLGAKWKPSNVGLDDVVLGSCAWGAKSVKNSHPSKAKKIRLISGRNSPDYSFGESSIRDVDPSNVGRMILEIWNERVSAVRKQFKTLRTVVLIKSPNLQELAVFELDTIRYDHELYNWTWNKRNNLEGLEKKSHIHKFTWQPHGSQFTIIENVPKKLLALRLKIPKKLNKDEVLTSFGFDNSWVKIISN